ncbi:hypothetical protein [Streptomyces roseolus]|uniref:hypothetical protein n=1 Tax=Streptomyces roseolus TaxID=67358 RepID=UPI00378D2CEF
MTELPTLPGDPSELRLRISYTDELADTPQADTLERWDVSVLHTEGTVGSITFYRVHLDRGMNAVRVMEEESEELDEIAQALLDPSTGGFTEDASSSLPYVGVLPARHGQGDLGQAVAWARPRRHPRH